MERIRKAPKKETTHGPESAEEEARCCPDLSHHLPPPAYNLTLAACGQGSNECVLLSSSIAP